MTHTSAAERLCRALGTPPASIIGLLCGLLVATAAAAFHEQGVAACNGCHVMHDSQDGLSVALGGVGEALLVAESPSDVCLTCHATELGAVLGNDPLAPPPELGGGNFVFLLEDDLNDAPDAVAPIPGQAAGHNIVAPGYGLFEDGRWSTSPGGSFPSRELGCTSCHDPHGSTSFRMLNGAGSVQGDLFIFGNPAPQAEGLSLSGPAESSGNHTAYRSGMAEWCANCHSEYHDRGVSSFEHDFAPELGGDEVNQYDRYNGDDDPQGGSHGTAYIPQVSFEDLTTTPDSTSGPTRSSVATCLSCHRAHASSSPAAGRWDFNVDKLAQDGTPSGSWPIPSPYPGPDQGRLCSKCHPGGNPITASF